MKRLLVVLMAGCGLLGIGGGIASAAATATKPAVRTNGQPDYTCIGTQDDHGHNDWIVCVTY